MFNKKKVKILKLNAKIIYILPIIVAGLLLVIGMIFGGIDSFTKYSTKTIIIDGQRYAQAVYSVFGQRYPGVALLFWFLISLLVALLIGFCVGVICNAYLLHIYYLASINKLLINSSNVAVSKNITAKAIAEKPATVAEPTNDILNEANVSTAPIINNNPEVIVKRPVIKEEPKVVLPKQEEMIKEEPKVVLPKQEEIVKEEPKVVLPKQEKLTSDLDNLDLGNDVIEEKKDDIISLEADEMESLDLNEIIEKQIIEEVSEEVKAPKRGRPRKKVE